MLSAFEGMNLVFEPGNPGIYALACLASNLRNSCFGVQAQNPLPHRIHIEIFRVQVIDLINQGHITYRKHERVVRSSLAIV
jgi:hypothetical protein